MGPVVYLFIVRGPLFPAHKEHEFVKKNALVLVLLLVASSLLSADQEYWPQWRGPNLNGGSQAVDLPTTWGVEENIVWSKKLPSWSGGTPVVWSDRIFLTSPNAGEEIQGGEQLLLGCLSAVDGSVLWQRTLDEGNAYWMKHNNTSPSPVTNGEVVIAVAGTGMIKAYDVEGEELWHYSLQEQHGAFGLMWGYASSPLLYDGVLFVEVLHGMNTDDPSYLVAFKAATGEVLWHRERATDAVGESPDAYTTPTLLEHDGQMQIVVSGGDYVTGHDPATGKELWRAGGLNPNKETNYRVAGSPVVADGMVYATSRRNPVLAFRAGGSGDISESHLAWKFEGAGGPDVPSATTDGRLFFMVDDRGRATCLDAKTGEKVWGPERLAQGSVSASPVLADGKLYVVNEDGVTTVLQAGPEFKVLATNELDGAYTLSSLAIAEGRIYLRTESHLYCIAQSEQK